MMYNMLGFSWGKSRSYLAKCWSFHITLFSYYVLLQAGYEHFNLGFITFNMVISKKGNTDDFFFLLD